MDKVLRSHADLIVKEAIAAHGPMGILTGGLAATAGGITAAIVAGLLASLLFKPKDKA